VCNGQVLDMRAMKSAQLVDFVHAGCTVLDKNTGIIHYHLLVHGQVTIIFVVSFGLFVFLFFCLSVCLCRVSLSRL